MHTQNAGRSFDMVESIWDVRLLTRVPRRASQYATWMSGPSCRNGGFSDTLCFAFWSEAPAKRGSGNFPSWLGNFPKTRLVRAAPAMPAAGASPTGQS